MSGRSIVWTGAMIMLSVISIVGYSTYSEKSFVNAFLAQEHFDETLNQVTIWETTDHLNESVADAKRNDARLEQVRQALENWHVRKTFFKNMNYEEAYQIDITYGEEVITIPISSDGYMKIQGHTYELVDGPQIKELLVLLE